jgi:hypothetical protein
VVEIPRDEIERRINEYDKEVQELRGQVKLLEDELSLARRKLGKLESAPRHIHVLEKRLSETMTELDLARENNERLATLLRDAREQLVSLKDEVEKLTQPPSSYGVFLQTYDDTTADVFTSGRKLRVHISPDVEVESVARGQEVMLNEALNVIGVCDYELQGEVVVLKELLEDGKRVLVIARADEERVVELADSLKDVYLRAGDSLLLETKSGHVIEKLPKPEVEELILEEVPPTRTSAGSTVRSKRSAMRWSFRSFTASSSRSTSSSRPRACCSTARRVAARRSSQRPSPIPWRSRWRASSDGTTGGPTSSTSKAPSSSTSTSGRPRGRSA